MKQFENWDIFARRYKLREIVPWLHYFFIALLLIIQHSVIFWEYLDIFSAFN